MLFRRIDAESRELHSHLSDDDECYYLIERTSNKNYSFSKANQLIANLKKKPSQSNHYELEHKGKAIVTCAKLLSSAINENWLKGATLVPIPGSKMVGHADYDNRIERICTQIVAGVDVRLLVRQTTSTQASHECAAGQRISLEDLLKIYSIDEGLSVPTPAKIGVVDDVLTAGTHFKAMKRILSERFPGVPIVGFFIARRVFPTADFSDF